MNFDSVSYLMGCEFGGGGGGGSLVLSGACKYALASNNIKSLREAGISVTTEDITDADYLMTCATETPTYTLNFADSETLGRWMFRVSEIEELPRISNLHISDAKSMFEACHNLKSVDDDFAANVDFSVLHAKEGTVESLYDDCHCLRYISSAFDSNAYTHATSGTYSYRYRNCYSLDEITAIPVVTGSISKNPASSAFSNTFHVKRIKFVPSESTCSWSSVAFDLQGCGYFSNSTIHGDTYFPASKKIADDATYEALKNDPDSWTADVAYSRYDHDSAAETLASLPTTSATNTIRFTGASGSATDAGAINTLTDAEIAVASAKNWTVALF